MSRMLVTSGAALAATYWNRVAEMLPNSFASPL